MLALRRAAAALPHTNLLRRLFSALSLGRQRIHLASLDDHMLRDIGIDRAAAEAEASRPIWDAPSHWRG